MRINLIDNNKLMLFYFYLRKNLIGEKVKWWTGLDHDFNRQYIELSIDHSHPVIGLSLLIV